MTTEQKKLKNKLTLVYWINIVIFLMLTIALIYHVGVDGKSVSETDFIMERFGIIAAIIVIPLSLKLFHSYYNKIVDLDLNDFLGRLNSLFTFRMLALDCVILLNLIGFYLIGALNFAYMAGFAMLAFTLCYPIESVIDPVEKDIENQDN